MDGWRVERGVLRAGDCGEQARLRTGAATVVPQGQGRDGFPAQPRQGVVRHRLRCRPPPLLPSRAPPGEVQDSQRVKAAGGGARSHVGALQRPDPVGGPAVSVLAAHDMLSHESDVVGTESLAWRATACPSGDLEVPLIGPHP